MHHSPTLPSARCTAIAAATLLALACASSAQASITNTGQLGIYPSFSGGTGPDDQVQDADGPIVLDGSATGGGNSSGSAHLEVQWGVIKAHGDSAGSLSSLARGIFRDGLTITAPGVTAGTLGTVTFSIVVDGTLNVCDIGLCSASWMASAEMGGSGGIHRTGTLSGGGIYAPNHGYSGDAFGVYTGSETFMFGFESQLSVMLTGDAQTAYSYDGGLPTSSFAPELSLYWGGIDGVTIDGVAVTDFDVTSASGTDYLHSTAPVPEPDGVLLMAGGLAMLGLRQRLRRGKA